MADRISRSVLLLAAGGLLTVVAAALIRFGDRHPGWEPIVWFIVAPACLAAALIFAIRLSAEWRASVALCLVATVVTLVSFEAYLRVSKMSRIDYRLHGARYWGYPEDRRDLLDVIREHEAQGKELWPTFIAHRALKPGPDGQLRSAIEVDGREVIPLAGISRTPTISDSEIGYWPIYESDRHGFRNPDSAWDAPTIDVLLLGDSFTFGSAVPWEDHFAGVLATRHRTLNLGYPAAGPIGYLAALVEFGGPVRPTHVLFCFFEGNDMHNLADDAKVPIMRRYLSEGASQGLREIQPQLDRAMREYITELRATTEAQEARGEDDPEKAWWQVILLRKVRELAGVKSFTEKYRKPVFDEVYPELLSELLAATRREAAAWGGQVHVVYLPAWNRGRSVRGTQAFLEEVRATVRASAQAAEVPFLDLTPEFESHPRPETLNAYPGYVGGHYSPEGYKLVGAALLRYLERVR